MVVGYLAIVKHFLRLRQTTWPFAAIRLEWEQRSNLREELLDTLQSGRHLGIDIIAKESGIYTRISGDMFLV